MKFYEKNAPKSQKESPPPPLGPWALGP